MRTRILLLAVVGVTLAPAAPARAAVLTALANDTSNQDIQGVFNFDSASPNTVQGVFNPIKGLNQGEQIVGIDFRPATGQLYGVTNANRLVTINPATGDATLVAPLSMTATGTSFGFDFDPVADRIRLVSDADQNLIIDPATGYATADAPLMYMGGSPDPAIIGNAFTNSVPGATSTTQYALDASANDLVTINGGLITPVGDLGVVLPPFAGFTIAPDGQAYFGAFTFFHIVNMTTGNAPSAGNFPSNFNVTGLAAVPPTGGTPGTPGTPGGQTPGGQLPGDFDLNGSVDAADYVVWRAATLNQDGFTVTIRTPTGVRMGSRTDLYSEWRANFGRVSGSRNGSAAQRRKAIRFARNTTTLRGQQSKRVRIRLTKAGRRAVRGYARKRLRATLTLRVTYRPAIGAARQTRTFKQKVTLRVKRKRR